MPFDFNGMNASVEGCQQNTSLLVKRQWLFFAKSLIHHSLERLYEQQRRTPSSKPGATSNVYQSGNKTRAHKFLQSQKCQIALITLSELKGVSSLPAHVIFLAGRIFSYYEKSSTSCMETIHGIAMQEGVSRGTAELFSLRRSPFLRKFIWSMSLDVGTSRSGVLFKTFSQQVADSLTFPVKSRSFQFPYVRVAGLFLSTLLNIALPKTRILGHSGTHIGRWRFNLFCI